MNTVTVDTYSEEETLELCKKVASQISFPQTLALHGDLGGGKTVFSRGLCRELGVEDNIASPTFTIVQEYPIGDKVINHMDLYRMAGDDDALSFGIEDMLNDPQALNLIEWPSRLTWLMPETAHHITFKHIEEDHRQITLPAELLP